MTTFFEKLKKGMEIEEMAKKEVAEEPASAKATAGKEEKKAIKRLKKEPKKKPEKEVKKEMEKKPQKEKIKVEKEPSKKDSGKKEKPEPIKENFSIENLGEPEGQLTVDVFETDQDIIIQSAIAGVDPENLDITIENDIVAIKGSRGKQLIEETQNYFRQECYWGKFSREIILPVEIDNSRAKAIIKNGILTIKIPKIKKVKIKKLVVEE